MLATIHHDFIAAAKRYRDNIAVWADDEIITYHDLHQRSNAFAQWLLHNQLAPRKRIAIILPKCIDTVVALLGTLKAGNTYVPLGASWPENRLASIVEVGDFALLIDNSTLAPCLEPGDPPTTTALATSVSTLGIRSLLWQETTLSANEQCQPFETLAEVSPDDLAYILYTSGSTGVPKGVCVSHAAARAFPHWAREELSINSDDRIASIAPFTFDLSTFDLFTTLASGATLYLVPERHKMLPSQLSLFFQQHGITRLYAVPSTLVLLTLRGQLPDRNLNALKTVLFAGEVFLPPAYRAFKALLPAHVSYYNLYGPTETNVCTYYKMPVIDDETDASIPIGLPLPGTRLFTLMSEDDGENEHYHGELCVAGPTVMSGYWGEPENTSTRQRHHWVAIPDEIYSRAYCTGDMVSQRADGNWLYHGRRDKMVKIWGYRIELGDVETCLLKHAAIEQAAVIKYVKPGQLGEMLVAFVVAGISDEKEPKALIAHCKQHLPHYMVPQKICWLDEMPFNHSGKIDRLQLEQSLEKQ